MNVAIEIHIITSGNRVLMAGSLPLKGRKPEKAALDWWKQIKKEMSYHAQLEKVIMNGDQDITEQVKELEQQELYRSMNDDLPF